MGRRKKGAITAAEMVRLAVRARMRKLTPEQRSAVARTAARARWAKATRTKTTTE